jgi:hypothetical protein
MHIDNALANGRRLLASYQRAYDEATTPEGRTYWHEQIRNVESMQAELERDRQGILALEAAYQDDPTLRLR